MLTATPSAKMRMAVPGKMRLRTEQSSRQDLTPGTEQVMFMHGSRSAPRNILTSTLVTAFSLMLAGCGRETETKDASPPRIVRTATVEKRKVTTPLTFSGRVEAEDEVNVAFRISGRLLSNDAKIGDRVQAGQVLARLESQNELNALAHGAGQSCRRPGPADAGAQSLRTSGHAAGAGLDHARKPRSGDARRGRRRSRRSMPPKRS